MNELAVLVNLGKTIQDAQMPTHNKGNILDEIFSSVPIYNIKVKTNNISDHNTITGEFNWKTEIIGETTPEHHNMSQLSIYLQNERNIINMID